MLYRRQHVIKCTRQLTHLVSWPTVPYTASQTGGMGVHGYGACDPRHFGDRLQPASGNKPASHSGKDSGNDNAYDEQATKCAQGPIDVVYSLGDDYGADYLIVGDAITVIARDRRGGGRVVGRTVWKRDGVDEDANL